MFMELITKVQDKSDRTEKENRQIQNHFQRAEHLVLSNW